jgi:hypothetical protein
MLKNLFEIDGNGQNSKAKGCISFFLAVLLYLIGGNGEKLREFKIG